MGMILESREQSAASTDQSDSIHFFPAAYYLSLVTRLIS